MFGLIRKTTVRRMLDDEIDDWVEVRDKGLKWPRRQPWCMLNPTAAPDHINALQSLRFHLFGDVKKNTQAISLREGPTRAQYLSSFLSGCADAADRGELLVNADLMREAASYLK